MAKNKKNILSAEDSAALIMVLKTRFEKNKKRHQQMEWSAVESKLKENPEKLWSLNEMEKTGGEPDVIAYDKKSDCYTFCDCSPESPKGRRSLCYDNEALQSRKAFKPANNAMDMAAEMGVEITTEAEYIALQELGTFDQKTSSWLKTPDAVRKFGGSIFGDFRFGRVFIYHNGAESYYGSRGFRGLLKV